MFGSTLFLGMGLMLLAVARFTGGTAGLGAVITLGVVSTAAACALQAGAIVAELRALPWPVRAPLTATGWLAAGIAALWALGSAPSVEALLALLTIPAVLGVAGLLVAHQNRGWGAAFLLEGAALFALLAPLLLPRLAG